MRENQPKFDLLRPATQKLYSVLRALLYVLFEVKGQVRSILNLTINVIGKNIKLETAKSLRNTNHNSETLILSWKHYL